MQWVPVQTTSTSTKIGFGGGSTLAFYAVDWMFTFENSVEGHLSIIIISIDSLKIITIMTATFTSINLRKFSHNSPQAMRPAP